MSYDGLEWLKETRLVFEFTARAGQLVPSHVADNRAWRREKLRAMEGWTEHWEDVGTGVEVAAGCTMSTYMGQVFTATPVT